MKVTITTIDDIIFTLDVGEDLDLGSFKVFCEHEAGIDADNLLVILNGNPLNNDNKSLKDLGMQDGDIVMLYYNAQTFKRRSRSTSTDAVAGSDDDETDRTRPPGPDDLLAIVVPFTEAAKSPPQKDPAPPPASTKAEDCKPGTSQKAKEEEELRKKSSGKPEAAAETEEEFSVSHLLSTSSVYDQLSSKDQFAFLQYFLQHGFSKEELDCLKKSNPGLAERLLNAKEKGEIPDPGELSDAEMEKAIELSIALSGALGGAGGGDLTGAGGGGPEGAGGGDLEGAVGGDAEGAVGCAAGGNVWGAIGGPVRPAEYEPERAPYYQLGRIQRPFVACHINDCEVKAFVSTRCTHSIMSARTATNCRVMDQLQPSESGRPNITGTTGLHYFGFVEINLVMEGAPMWGLFHVFDGFEAEMVFGLDWLYEWQCELSFVRNWLWVSINGAKIPFIEEPFFEKRPKSKKKGHHKRSDEEPEDDDEESAGRKSRARRRHRHSSE